MRVRCVETGEVTVVRHGALRVPALRRRRRAIRHRDRLPLGVDARGGAATRVCASGRVHGVRCSVHRFQAILPAWAVPQPHTGVSAAPLCTATGGPTYSRAIGSCPCLRNSSFRASPSRDWTVRPWIAPSMRMTEQAGSERPRLHPQPPLCERHGGRRVSPRESRCPTPRD